MAFLNDCFEFFFPRSCIACRRFLLRKESFVCTYCWADLPRTSLHTWKDNELEKLFWGRFPIVRATSYFYYNSDNNVHHLLYELKYYGNARLGVFLGRCMANELKQANFFEGIDYLVPVPLHPRKKRYRGYNQSERLAAGIAAITGIPVNEDTLIRTRDTQTQTRQSVTGRWDNVKDVFTCTAPGQFQGKHILLIDDVVTTGATVTACADAISKIPGIRISVLSLAWAGHT